MKAPNKLVIAALLGVVLLAAVTAFASAKSTKKAAVGVSGSVSIVGVWTGDEEKSFNAVLAGFKKLSPGCDTDARSGGLPPATAVARTVGVLSPVDL